MMMMIQSESSKTDQSRYGKIVKTRPATEP